MEAQVNELIAELRRISSPEIKRKKDEKFGIRDHTSWGVYQKDLSQIAKRIGKNTKDASRIQF